MAFKITNCKETALKAFIVEWLKDPSMYCNVCGNRYFGKDIQGEEMCCDTPQIGTNLQILSAITKQNLEIQNNMAKDTGANKDNTFRWGISIPPRLLHDMEEYSMNTLKEPLFRDDGKDMNDFMRAFPFLRTCRKV